ncbi:GTPase RsgA [Undibacterium sp. Ji49W]|uniref:GTPase RsgA n=1 Tax=Undibacterium sp. Ji49W TaxID=3413040 RepID=UPI003BEFA604
MKPVVLDTGKHTTTFTRLYHIDDNSCVIDSPGFQEFGLHHLSDGMLPARLRDFGHSQRQQHLYHAA